VNELYDLFYRSDATEDQLDFPSSITNARAGIAKTSLKSPPKICVRFSEAIVKHIPVPPGMRPNASNPCGQPGTTAITSAGSPSPVCSRDAHLGDEVGF